MSIFYDDKHSSINSLISKLLSAYYDPQLQTGSFPQVYDDSTLF